ncbi:ribosome maturation factor RimP [Laceyella sacchari]|uniref:Ribosome maturation factor RimP n=1 Tax=Laceyella sacchari TaxID=37482 RepID=A0ABY5U337_LACSH|nr:ribosome maturation factor RimP [Laceyella sacchari]KPC76980.1 ribosome maturation factor RimP [Thermoactinomyces vulgaris]TCW35670.1 ribosome maturation factor RimP [Laceyella sacchari]UWE02493.1 ribosome maturation factor RimP [Laceyella sacchari]
MSRQVSEVVEKIALPIIEAEGLELVDVEYKKEGTNWFLRVFIDREDKPVDLDDCSRVSERLSEVLDETDPIPGAYILEVSSPGAERPLKKENDFHKAIGKHVHVTTYEPIDGQKVFEGVLKEVDSVSLTVEEKKKTVHIPREKVAKARLAIVF